VSKEPQIAQLSHNSIGRSRVVGRTKLGLPKEETIPAVRGVYQYDRDGSRVFTPTHSHRLFVKHLDQHVRPRVLTDLLLEGFLEEGVCPYAPREALDKKPAVEPPEGFNSFCRGDGEWDPRDGIGGCEHLKAIVRGRRALTKERALLRKPPSNRQQDMKDIVAAVMAAMRAEGVSAAAPAGGGISVADITAVVERVMAERAGVPAAPPSAPVPPLQANGVGLAGDPAAGKNALASARNRTRSGRGERDEGDGQE
jgi:hypothetical protein